MAAELQSVKAELMEVEQQVENYDALATGEWTFESLAPA
jgi:hypothetical protein